MTRQVCEMAAHNLTLSLSLARRGDTQSNNELFLQHGEAV